MDEKYLLWHNRFIARCRETNPSFKFEHSHRHHIIPKCIGGSNDASNLIYLTVEQHLVAHWILSKAYPKSNLVFALYRFSDKDMRGNKWLLYLKTYLIKVFSRDIRNENCPSSRFSNSQILDMMEMQKQGKSIKEIAIHFNAPYRTIQTIFCGKSYSDITNIKHPKWKDCNNRKTENNSNTIFTKEIVDKALDLHSKGLTLKEISDQLRRNKNNESFQFVQWQNLV